MNQRQIICIGPIIKVIHKINEGLGFARNSGLEIATGEYIAFLDSDDFVDVNMYEQLYLKAKAKDIDVVYCNCNIYKDKKHIYPRKDVERRRLSSEGVKLLMMIFCLI
ncbi:glycosyltransferase [Phocaeicola vulgatus]|nr:glycosyltransferase [Phocaeicola vulgatus]